QRVGAEFVDDLQRVDGVAFRLRHLLALLVADQCVDVDVLERDLAHEMDALHHHSGNPEEDDVECGDEDGARVAALARWILLRPALRRERPEAGGEPGVEDVFVLPDWKWPRGICMLMNFSLSPILHENDGATV